MIKILKTVKIKEKVFIKNKIIPTLESKIAEHLISIGVACRLHPHITKNCIVPFECELIENFSCKLIDGDMKNACLGPYKVIQDEIISYIAIK